MTNENNVSSVVVSHEKFHQLPFVTKPHSLFEREIQRQFSGQFTTITKLSKNHTGLLTELSVDTKDLAKQPFAHPENHPFNFCRFV